MSALPTRFRGTQTRTVLPEDNSPQESSIWQYLWTGLCGGILSLVLGMAVLVIGVPAVVGGMPVTVLSGSMEPSYSPGDLVVIRPTPADEVQVGQVLTYQLRSDDPTLVTHRVLSRSMSTNGELTFITQGDANDTPDEQPVKAVQVVGSVWYTIPWLGWVNQAISGQTRQWLIPVAAGLLFIYALWNIFGGFIHRGRGTKNTP
ncbi:Signal peptidase I W [Corynebacterium occultum]|uniref:Signal peptidase I n=1 Tax=Corynebacterium occultum TaxID=2675219 RepID=A0A6B8VZN7_9CORY|nr:signal peptidase I [Corynebacterium occultum]QGU08459.1 Signal peptidase I W [Corynebacterium occultum]